MSFESARSMGRAATLLIVLATVVIPIISVAAFFVRLLPTLYLSIIFSIPSYAGYVLFLVAMNRFANYYGERAIFKNALYGFAALIVGVIVFYLLIFGVFSPVMTEIIRSAPRTGTPPDPSIIISLMRFILLVWVGAFVMALLQGLFFRRAFYALAEKSGESNFRQAGLMMLLGGVLTIVVVGSLLFFVGWIFAVLGFFSMKTGVYEASSARRVPLPVEQVRYCSKCGKENASTAVFCSYCGNRLWQEATGGSG